MHAPRKEIWHRRFVRSGYFVAALLFHLILFLLFATWVIFKAPPPPPTDVFHHVTLVKVPPPPPQPASSGDAANNPEFEPQPVVVPVVTPPSVIITANSAFTLDAPKILDQTLNNLSDRVAQGAGLTSGGGDKAPGTGTAFGSFKGANTLLSGYFIDLKQTNKRQPTGMTEDQYFTILRKYLSQGWDDSLLAPYYKSKSPLYNDTIAISTRPSEAAPKAFGLENEVQSGLWVVHYHARVEAPVAGDYRLAGFGDNVLAVRINGTNVLDGGWNSLSDDAHLQDKLPFIFPSYVAYGFGDPHLRIGVSFHLDIANPVDMDVLIGDSGGVCSFFLLIEKEGNTYAKLSDGTPVLPFFQLSTKAAPTFKSDEEHPPFSTTPEPWQGMSN